MKVSGTQQVDPQAIESELDKVWAQLYGDPQSGSLTRAAMSNLLVFCGDEQQALNATDRIVSLVEQHPSRVLILALQDDASRGMEAWVSVHCRSIGEHQQLCAEHIELRFHATAIDRAISIIRPLLIGDLPTALWWFSPVPPPLMGDVFEGLVSLSQHIIYDSVGWTRPVDGVRAMAAWIQQHDSVVYNLAWRRLKSWRRMLALGLDPEFNPGALQGLSEIDIVHGPDALPLAWLLIAWLAGRLGWRVQATQCEAHQWIEWQFASQQGRVRVRIRLDSHAAQRIIETMDIKWTPASGQPGRARFYTEGHHLLTDEQYSSIPPITRPLFEFKLEQLVAAQMAHRYSDRLFMQTIKLAAEMATALPIR